MSRLDFLLLWHRTFASYVQRALEGEVELRIDPDEIADPTRCDVGQWIARQKGRITESPAFAHLVRCHRTYHQLTGRLVQVRLSARRTRLDAASRQQFLQSSEAVTDAIAALIERRDCSQPPRVPPSEPLTFWDDRLRIGIDLIDEQHASIAELATRVAQTPATALSSETGIDFLADLHRLLAFHFETEEQLMAVSSFPPDLRAAHVQEHTKLLTTVVNYSYDQTRGKGPVTVADILPDLRGILVTHVTDFDFGLKGLAT